MVWRASTIGIGECNPVVHLQKGVLERHTGCQIRVGQNAIIEVIEIRQCVRGELRLHVLVDLLTDSLVDPAARGIDGSRVEVRSRFSRSVEPIRHLLRPANLQRCSNDCIAQFIPRQLKRGTPDHVPTGRERGIKGWDDGRLLESLGTVREGRCSCCVFSLLRGGRVVSPDPKDGDCQDRDQNSHQIGAKTVSLPRSFRWVFRLSTLHRRFSQDARSAVRFGPCG